MTDQFPTARTRRTEPLSVLWGLLAAPQTLMVLLGCFVLVLILSGLVPQISPEAKDDPQAWLALQPGLSGARLQLVRALVLYDLYHTFWFRTLMVLLGLVLVVRFVDSAELAWQGTGRQRWMTASVSRWSGGRPLVKIPTSLLPGESLARLRGFLEERGYRCSFLPNQVVPDFVASRREVLLWVRALGYCALLLALAGLVILDSKGWENDGWQPAVGETMTVGRGTSLVVRMDRFELESELDGRLNGYHSEITWLDADKVLAPARVGLGAPSARQGIAVRMTGYVPVVRIRGWDQAGGSLAFQVPGGEEATPGDATIVFPAPAAQPLLFLPAQDQLLALSFDPLSSEGRPVLHLAVSSGEPTGEQVSEALYRSERVNLGGLELEVDLSYRPILRLDYRPGMHLILAGLILALATLTTAWLIPTPLVCLTLSSQEPGPDDPGLALEQERSTVVGLLTPSAAEWTLWWHRLVEDLREVLDNDD